MVLTKEVHVVVIAQLSQTMTFGKAQSGLAIARNSAMVDRSPNLVVYLNETVT